MAPLHTEIAFHLPRGYIDAGGSLHRDGIMRMARARDEVEPLEDPRARANDAYLSVLLLSRVIVRLGTIEQVSPEIVEDLFASDFAYLQDLYLKMNLAGDEPVETRCPGCGETFELDLLAMEAHD